MNKHQEVNKNEEISKSNIAMQTYLRHTRNQTLLSLTPLPPNTNLDIAPTLRHQFSLLTPLGTDQQSHKVVAGILLLGDNDFLGAFHSSRARSFGGVAEAGNEGGEGLFDAAFLTSSC